MSRIGKQPVLIKDGVTLSLEDGVVVASGPKGKLSFAIPDQIAVAVENGSAKVSMIAPSKQLRALFGLTRASIANMVKGVSEGFSKELLLSGVGYRAQTSGQDLSLSVGFSHPVKFVAPTGVTFAVVENTITISGIDKKLVGDIAAEIRSVRPPEPYKGKGISYKGERIRRKAGKAAKAVGTTK